MFSTVAKGDAGGDTEHKIKLSWPYCTPPRSFFSYFRVTFLRIDHSPIKTFYVTRFLHHFFFTIHLYTFTAVQIINASTFFTTSQNYFLSSSIYYSCVSYSIKIFNYGAFDLILMIFDQKISNQPITGLYSRRNPNTAL